MAMLCFCSLIYEALCTVVQSMCSRITQQNKQKHIFCTISLLNWSYASKHFWDHFFSEVIVPFRKSMTFMYTYVIQYMYINGFLWHLFNPSMPDGGSFLPTFFVLPQLFYLLIFPSDISWQKNYKCLERVSEVKSGVAYMMRVAEFF